VTEPAVDVRKQLSRLILDGLMGRSLKQLAQQLRVAFHAAGEELSQGAIDSWVGGVTFPATKKRQDLIAVVVGGPCGDAIAKLPGPAFRGYRRRVAAEETTMKDNTYGGSHRGRWATRKFENISTMDEDGIRRTHPVIRCAACDRFELHRGRKGKLEDADLFRAKGWETGDSASRDFCPNCVSARKVVKMEDHKKPAPAPAVATTVEGISKEDGRILSRLIEDHWDDVHCRYMPTWSDLRLAEDCGKPIEHVRMIRERDFGGVGEDPLLTDFVAATVSITGDLDLLRADMEGLAASVSTLTSQADKSRALLDKYRDSHNALAAKVKHLKDTADQLRPFEDKNRKASA
jgi:hypothetical protein